MKNFKSLYRIALVGMVLMTGCSNDKINDLPKNAVPIEYIIFVDQNVPDSEYALIKHNGREYISYGIQGDTIKESIILECFGYGATDDNERYYSLVDTDDYIASYYLNGEMMQFDFYRAVDTIGKEIYTPNYIENLEYDIWK